MIWFILFFQIEWNFTRVPHKHLTCPIPILYVTVVNVFAKCNVIACPAIFEPAAGFVPSDPKNFSRPFYYLRTKVDNFFNFHL
jgi:hypothetical protein